jgi:hypothetical protein
MARRRREGGAATAVITGGVGLSQLLKNPAVKIRFDIVEVLLADNDGGKSGAWRTHFRWRKRFDTDDSKRLAGTFAPPILLAGNGKRDEG